MDDNSSGYPPAVWLVWLTSEMLELTKLTPASAISGVPAPLDTAVTMVAIVNATTDTIKPAAFAINPKTGPAISAPLALPLFLIQLLIFPSPAGFFSSSLVLLMDKPT